MTPTSRRDFLLFAGAASAGFLGLNRCFALAQGDHAPIAPGFGPLVRDPARLLDLPEGFSYRIISRLGDEMHDGLIVPGLPDGMAAFEGEGGLTILVRNHELDLRDQKISPFGPRAERLARIPRHRLYDPGREGRPAPAGTTTLVYDTREHRLVREFLSSAGHARNCAGGITPWGSWLTCEETVTRAGEDGAARDHGYVFEVPATAEIRIADPVPLRALGRFNHEAVCIDPRTGIVYQTEDRGDGLLYRLIPKAPGRLHEGGVLQALAVRDRPGLDTRNWEGAPISLDQTLEVEWIDLENIESPEDDLRLRGFRAGAARFARGEGIHWGDGSAYIVCTNGGRAKRGQVWRYTPSPAEGAASEQDAPGRLALFVEPNNRDLLDMPDNIAVAPWGDLILCEDGSDDQFLVAVTPEGRLSKLARNARSGGEFAGACFSPDASTMFVNMQHEGLTLAITGPWKT